MKHFPLVRAQALMHRSPGMAAPVIYLSASPADLRTHRIAARAILEAEGLRVVEFEFRGGTGWRAVRQSMREKLRQCDAVVHLAGICFGAEPNAVPSGAPRRSYAQLEYHLASDLGLPCYSVLLAEDFPFDAHAPEDPCASVLQQQHRHAITEGLSGSDSVHDPGDLQWSLEELANRLRIRHVIVEEPIAPSSWLMRLPLLLLITMALVRIAGEHFSTSSQSQLTDALADPEAAAALHEMALIESIESRKLMLGIAASAARAGSTSEQYDPITKLELAIDEAASRRSITAGEAKAEMEKFVREIVESPGSIGLDQALATYATGDYQGAADLANLAATEAEQQRPPNYIRSLTAWMLKGHSHMQALQYPAALASYGSALAHVDKDRTPLLWSNSALMASLAMVNLAQWDEARTRLTEVLQIFETHPEADAAEHALALRTMARLHLAAGNTRDAEELSRRACNLLEDKLGKEHPGNTTSLIALGEVLRITNNHARAEEIFCRAIAIQENSRGAEHPQVARILGNLAVVLADTGRLAQGMVLCERALVIDEKQCGPEHPRVARDLIRLASLTSRSQDAAKSVALHRRALAIRMKVFGEEHPDTASAMASLAISLGSIQERAEAEALVRKSLAVDEAFFGSEHPQVLRDVRNLAVLLRASGRKGEALPLYRRALAISELKYGPAHAETSRGLASLALALSENSQYEDAEPLYRRALSIDEKQYGPEDFRVFWSVKNLAGVLRDSGKRAEALDLFRRALAMARRNLAPDDPGLAVELGNVGSMLRTVGQYTDAELLFREALSIQEKATDPRDPMVAEMLNNLAGVLFLSGRHADAEPVYRRVLDMLSTLSRSSGQPHPNLELARKNYRADLKRMGLSDEEINTRTLQVEAGEPVQDLKSISAR